MSADHKAKSSKKHRKHGRNSIACLRYKNENRREKNKAKKLVRHLAAYPNDHCATSALGNCRVAFGRR